MRGAPKTAKGLVEQKEKDESGQHCRTGRAGAAKQVVLERAARHCGLVLRDAGRAFGGLTPSAVTMALRRGRERRSEDAALRALFGELDQAMAAASQRAEE